MSTNEGGLLTSLCPAGLCGHVNGIFGNPLGIEEESEGLLDVGKQEVGDEEDELVGCVGLEPPLDHTVDEEEEERSGGNEGEEGQSGDRNQANVQLRWQWRESPNL